MKKATKGRTSINQFLSPESLEWGQFTQVKHNITESFRYADRELLVKYLDWLYTNISSSIQGIRRTATFIVALMAAFELIVNSGATASITIFSFAISKHSIVIQFVPAVTAYLVMQNTGDSLALSKSYKAFTSAFGLLFNNRASGSLDEYIWPSSQIFWGPLIGKLDVANLSVNERIRNGMLSAFEGIAFVFFAAFEVQAYSVLFVPHFGRELVYWLVSATFSLFCNIASIVILLSETTILSAMEDLFRERSNEAYARKAASRI